jgi:LAO/AO transport system kinase
MQDHVSDPGVFIRSMSTRGALGGLSTATEAALVVLDAAGFDLIVVETVGVGQSEVDVMSLVETTVVVVAPGFGDGVQAAKAGVLEIGDIFVVNKSDLAGADAVVRDLNQMLELGVRGSWVPPIVTTSALDGSGVADLWTALASRQAHLASPSGVAEGRARAELAVRRAFVARLTAAVVGRQIPSQVIDDVLARSTDPWTAAARLAQSD